MKYLRLIGRYIWNLGYSFDVFLNAVLGGDPRETVSSRLGKEVVENDGSCRVCHYICKALDLVFFEKDHCQKAINRAHGDWSDDNREVIDLD